MNFLEFIIKDYKYQRVFGSSTWRGYAVFLFVLNTIAWGLALIVFLLTGREPQFPFITVTNFIFSMITGWCAWPTLTGSAGSKKENDDESGNT